MNKKTILWVVAIVMVLGVATAELVNYLGNRREVEFEVQESTAISLDNDTWVMPTQAGQDSMFVVGVNNNLAGNVTSNMSINLQENVGGNWVNVTDDAGWYIAYTSVVSCCLEGYCKQTDDKTGITDCKAQYQQWMTQNPTWIWWLKTQNVTDGYTHPLVNNVTSYYTPMVDGSIKFDIELHPGKQLGAIYVGTDARLKGGDYRLVVEV